MPKTIPRLTPEMQKAMDIIAEHGYIRRYHGGFWAGPGCDDIVRWYETDGAVNITSPYVSIGTLWGLERRGHIQSHEIGKVKSAKAKFTIVYIAKKQTYAEKKGPIEPVAFRPHGRGDADIERNAKKVSGYDRHGNNVPAGGPAADRLP